MFASARVGKISAKGGVAAGLRPRMMCVLHGVWLSLSTVQYRLCQAFSLNYVIILLFTRDVCSHRFSKSHAVRKNKGFELVLALDGKRLLYLVETPTTWASHKT